ncbi:UNVERIFIED_CONTAM: CsbD family protein [Kocuria sp. CPCC 205316]|uniref:CsbD family protein n=1 Tax=Kocuria TaxID=57493 RepID=UPI0036D7F5C2
MGLDDKIRNATDKAVGSAKEAVGGATDNRDLQAEGKVQKTAGSTKQAGEHLKDAARNVGGGLKS